MGMDFLDMTFRLEKRFGIRLDWTCWEGVIAGRKKFDLTAAEVASVVEERRTAIRRLHATFPHSAGPVVLDYETPGTVADYDEDTWPGVRQAIAETLGAKPEEVRPESWLVRDLGMT